VVGEGSCLYISDAEQYRYARENREFIGAGTGGAINAKSYRMKDVHKCPGMYTCVPGNPCVMIYSPKEDEAAEEKPRLLSLRAKNERRKEPHE